MLENHSKIGHTSAEQDTGNSKIHSSDSADKLQQMRFPGGATREETVEKYLGTSEEKIERVVNNGGLFEITNVTCAHHLIIVCLFCVGTSEVQSISRDASNGRTGDTTTVLRQ